MNLIEIKPNHYINPQQVVSVQYTPESSREAMVPHERGGLQQGTKTDKSRIVVTLTVGSAIDLRGQEADDLAAKLLG